MNEEDEAVAKLLQQEPLTKDEIKALISLIESNRACWSASSPNCMFAYTAYAKLTKVLSQTK